MKGDVKLGNGLQTDCGLFRCFSKLTSRSEQRCAAWFSPPYVISYNNPRQTFNGQSAQYDKSGEKHRIDAKDCSVPYERHVTNSSVGWQAQNRARRSAVSGQSFTADSQ